jgi:hypothetical protein
LNPKREVGQPNGHTSLEGQSYGELETVGWMLKLAHKIMSIVVEIPYLDRFSFPSGV